MIIFFNINFNLAGLHPPPQGFDLVRIIHSLRSFIMLTGQTSVDVEVFRPQSIKHNLIVKIISIDH